MNWIKLDIDNLPEFDSEKMYILDIKWERDNPYLNKKDYGRYQVMAIWIGNGEFQTYEHYDNVEVSIGNIYAYLELPTLIN